MTLPDPAEWPTEYAVEEPMIDLLRQRADSTPDRTALVDADTGKSTSYAAFDRRVGLVATEIERLCGDSGRVALLTNTRPAFATLYFAIARLGRTVVSLNVQLSTDALRDQVARVEPELLACERATEETALAVAHAETAVASVDKPGESGVGQIAVNESTPEEHATASAAEPVSTPPDTDRLVMFTSGTTGQPKGVRLTVGNLVASAVGSAFRLGVDPADRWLVCLPTYHMGGLAPVVRSTLYGTTTVMQRSFGAEKTARVVDEYDVTGVSLVPTMLSRLLDADWRPPERLRFVLLGGAPAPEDLLRRALDRDIPVYPTYGLTETASQVATATPADAARYPGTVGRPLSTASVSLHADDGSLVNPRETGELVVDGPTVTPGYLDDEQTAAAFSDDGLHTGDVGYRDDEGRLWVVGRVDDRIVTGGENVHPTRVADALRDHDDIADAAVVGIPDEEWGERVAALVAADSGVSTAELRAFARDRLADFAVPKTVAFADDLPRTASGTVNREAVKARLRDEEA